MFFKETKKQQILYFVVKRSSCKKHLRILFLTLMTFVSNYNMLMTSSPQFSFITQLVNQLQFKTLFCKLIKKNNFFSL